MTAIQLLILAQKEMYVAVCIEATEKLGNRYTCDVVSHLSLVTAEYFREKGQ